MAYHTIQLSDATYTLLLKRAVRLQITPDQVLEWLVSSNIVALDPEADSTDAISSSSDDLAQAIAAVRRLSTLFADLVLPDLDQILHDPLLSLANVDLLEPIG